MGQGQRCYVMWEHGMAEKDRVYFLQFPLATKEVNHLMLRLLKEIDGIPIISQNLVRVNFLCATTGAGHRYTSFDRINHPILIQSDSDSKMADDIPKKISLTWRLHGGDGVSAGDSIITLLYEEPLLVGWREAAQALSVKLGCSIMARSRQVRQIM